MRQPIQVAIYCVKISSNQPMVLLLKRNWETGSFWQGVTGGVEDNEKLMAAAKRELYEETGFDVEKLQRIDYNYYFPTPKDMIHLYEPDTNLISEYSFLAVINSNQEPVIDPKEHSEFKWCTFDEAEQLLYWHGNREALKKSLELL